VICAESKKLRQTEQRGLIGRLGDVLKKHEHEDFPWRPGWM
jgi:hypothetical protein